MYSIDEELDRKVSETLVDIITRQTSGLMPTYEAKAAIHAVFCSVMGLVGNEVAELLEEAMNSIEKERPSPFPLYLKTTGGVYISVAPDITTRKVMVRVMASEYKPVEYECDSAAATMKKALSVVHLLIKQGAERL